MRLHHVADAAALAALLRHYAHDEDAPRLAAVLLAASLSRPTDRGAARYH